jgi:SAM-dependent methyltransferase
VGKDTRVVEERWGDEESTAALWQMSWTSCTPVCRYLNRRATGIPEADWLTWLDNIVLRSRGAALDCLVLGCGDGWLERALAPSPVVRHIDAMDVSPKAVERARRQAAEHGLARKVHYSVKNLDHEDLPVQSYDVVIAHSVLHHVERLEHVYQQIEDALRRGGLLVINEYVGPRRLQFTRTQMGCINALMSQLPEQLRRSALTGEILNERICPPIESVQATDPSEAIRSDEVIEVARQRFDFLVWRDCGGTILHPLLYEIAPNFKDGDPEHEAILGMLCSLEENLIESGALPSDFVFALAKRRCDESVAFTIPSSHDANETERAPVSPWICTGKLPVTMGIDAIQEHLNRRVSGREGYDALTWCLDQVRSSRFRPLRRSRALLLESSELAGVLSRHFKTLECGVEGAEAHDPFHALFSLGTLGTEALCDPEVVQRLAQRLVKGGNLVALAPVRQAGEISSPEVVSAVRSLASQLPSRISLPELDVPVPPGAPTARAVSIGGIRSALAQHFTVTFLRPLGWSVLQVLVPLLSGQIDVSRDEDRALVRLLCQCDQQLSDHGAIEPEFVLIIATRS